VHSKSPNLCQRQNFNWKWFGIRIQICISVGSVPKCRGYTLPRRRQSFRQVWYKSAIHCMKNANRCPKNPPFRNDEENADPDHPQKLTTLRWSLLAQVRSASVSRSSVKLTEWQTERSHNLHLVSRGNNANFIIWTLKNSC